MAKPFYVILGVGSHNISLNDVSMRLLLSVLFFNNEALVIMHSFTMNWECVAINLSSIAQSNFAQS